jgi:hypothetical protein
MAHTIDPVFLSELTGWLEQAVVSGAAEQPPQSVE